MRKVGEKEMLLEETYKFWDEKIEDISIDLIKCEMKISFSNLSIDLIFKKVKEYMYKFDYFDSDSMIEEVNSYIELNIFELKKVNIIIKEPKKKKSIMNYNIILEFDLAFIYLYAEEIQIGENVYSLSDYYNENN